MLRPTWRTIALVATAFILGTIAAGSGSLRAAWTPMARLIGLQDPRTPASANVLSDHEIEVLDSMSPQCEPEPPREAGILRAGTDVDALCRIEPMPVHEHHA